MKYPQPLEYVRAGSTSKLEQDGRPTDITVTFNNEALPDTAAGSPAFIQAIYSTRARGIF